MSKIPIPIIVLDVIGTLLIAYAFYKHFSPGQGNVPDWAGGVAIIWMMIGLGVLLILPLPVWLIRNAGKNRRD